ncbi:MAG: coproporphyrinogen dehydrogenase HemZ [Lachnospiraceae bacterium]|nr:coproporphyrinogen dehydrogenase HemZ [Lachnospiraceae bacterium]
MIKILSFEESFSYDIHSLAQAFFPGEEVKVSKDFQEEEADYLLSLSPKEAILSGERDCVFSGSTQSVLLFADAFGKAEQAVFPADIARPLLKSEIKRLIYRCLSKWLGKTLPWGTLTGIRPTKIAMDLLKQGEGEEAVLARMEEWYLASSKKSLLALEIAQREKRFIERIAHPEGYSFYIGIPFCPTRCLYCSFASNPIGKFRNQTGRYLAALFKELEAASKLTAGRHLDSLYIGGGTPTALSEEELEALLEKVEAYFSPTEIEYTLEAGRPDSITKEKLALMKRFGITRISVNPQTMNQKTLDLIGRQHSVEQTFSAYEMARDMGFGNINMDIILGLPGEGEEEVRNTLAGISKLRPDSLTVHSLAVKRASRLKEELTYNAAASKKNLAEEPPKPSHKSREMNALMEMAESYAQEMGLVPYYLYRQKNMAGNLENVGYAKEGFFGAYNVLMMEEVQDIVACGAGTISKKVYPDGRIERADDVKDLHQYCERIEEMLERKRRLFS